MANDREFKGIWIPREIWLDERLSALDKIILAEIDSFSGTERGCVAGNTYLADFCQCSASKVSKSINLLKELGYVRQVSFDGRRRVLQSSLVKNARQDSKKCEAAEQKMLTISIGNNIDIKKREKGKKRTRFVPPPLEEVSSYCEERRNGIDPQRFIDFYESKGWYVGKNKMKDWKAAVRTWEQRDNQTKASEYKTDNEEWGF